MVCAPLQAKSPEMVRQRDPQRSDCSLRERFRIPSAGVWLLRTLGQVSSAAVCSAGVIRAARASCVLEFAEDGRGVAGLFPSSQHSVPPQRTPVPAPAAALSGCVFPVPTLVYTRVRHPLLSGTPLRCYLTASQCCRTKARAKFGSRPDVKS